MNKVPKYAAVFFAVLVLLFGGYAVLYKLGNEPFQDYDEATYALITQASIEQGVPSALSFLNQPFLRKPPLLFWMTTATVRIFHSAEFADRLPSALAGLAAAVIVALICIEAGAGAWTGIVAAAILVTTAGWMEFARDVRFDNLVSFFDVLALYAALRATRDSRWFLMVGVALALAILSKNVIVLFGGIAVLAVLVYEGVFKRALRDRQFWYGIGIFFLIAAPWHIYMTLTYGTEFWHSYLGTEVFERAGTNLFPGGNNPTNGQYLRFLFGNSAPWMELFALAAVCTPFLFRTLPRRMRSAFLSALIAALSVLVVAFVAKTKAFGYVMPFFPFMAVVVALFAWQVWQWVGGDGAARRGRAAIFQPLLIGVAGILFAFAAALTRFEALHLDPIYGWAIGQANEERDVGRIIRVAPNPQVFEYNGYDFLGSVYYYSGLPDTQNPYILLWDASSTPSATTTNFILATSSLGSLSSASPRYHFVQDYSGKFVSLFTVTR